MKKKIIILSTLLFSLTSTAFAFDNWDASRCENGGGSILTVYVQNETNAPIYITNTNCQKCGVSINGSTVRIPKQMPGTTWSYQTCGYHSGDQNYDYFNIAVDDGGLINIAAGNYFDFDNNAEYSLQLNNTKYKNFNVSASTILFGQKSDTITITGGPTANG